MPVVRTAHEIWPTVGLPGSLSSELALPSHFEQAVKRVTEEEVAERVICGPDPERYIAAIQNYIDVGFDHVSLHQIGPDQAGFFAFYQQELLTRLEHVTQS